MLRAAAGRVSALLGGDVPPALLWRRLVTLRPARQVLARYASIAEGTRPFAVLVHLLLAVGLLALLVGWRPSRRAVAHASALPCASVAVVAVGHGNGLDALVFGLLLALLASLARRTPDVPVAVRPSLATWVGAALIAFGWVYPYHLAAPSGLGSLYAAPLGLLPCPTLALVLGVQLALPGPGSRSGRWVPGLAGIGYGLHGALGLGLPLDLVLAGGALALLGGAGTARGRVRALVPTIDRAA